MIRWSNLLVIFRREVLDQLRDRRTLFMIVVFPILLYPILGFGITQAMVAMEKKPRLVVVVGAEHLPAEHPLLNEHGDGFNPRYFDSPVEASLLRVQQEQETGPWANSEHRQAAIRSELASAVMMIPPDLPEQFREKRDVEIPILYRSVDEPSQITYLRLREVLDRWKRGIVDERTKQDNLPQGYTQPIQVKGMDVATAQEVGGSVWSRIFPFLLVMMSLTGAFYPAVDLCAGEKERGTMETLLISPASRAEIVLGKFLTVMLASVMTAILNLVSMGLTGIVMARRGGLVADQSHHAAAAVGLTPPSLHSAFWMIFLLIPLAAFFSAICVALAVLAKSMKEGQYYMTPLYLICLPLIMLTLVPELKLNLFYSLVPITGVALLLRALIMGDYHTGFTYFIPVMLPTVVYAWLALLWAIDQFNREEVLFREAERFSLGVWLKHLVHHRTSTPSAGQAVLCFSLMLSAFWFLIVFVSFQGMTPETATSMMIMGQALIFLIPVIMAVLLTSSPARTLRLSLPAPRHLALAVIFPFALNPLVNLLGYYVQQLFPISSTTEQALKQMVSGNTTLLTAVFCFALLPAICEETAFRGFILSGLQRRYRPLTAILLSSLMFGFLHVLISIYQQLFNATLLGIVLGLLAVRSRSLLPGIIFHFLNNALAVTQAERLKWLDAAGISGWLYRDTAEGLYHVAWIVASFVVSLLLFLYLWKVDRPKAKITEPLVHEMAA